MENRFLRGLNFGFYSELTFGLNVGFNLVFNSVLGLIWCLIWGSGMSPRVNAKLNPN